MRIAVVGATGRTGRHVVEQGLRRGHVMRAVARRPPAPGSGFPTVQTAAADALDAESVGRALEGVDVVISTLGVGASRAPTELYSRGTANLLAAMDRNRIARLVAVSAAPAGPRAQQPRLERRVLMPLLELAFGATYADMRRMEALLAASAVDWVALRPPRLVDRPATGRYRLAAVPPAGARTITCGDLAAAALDVGERGEPSREAVYVAG